GAELPDEAKITARITATSAPAMPAIIGPEEEGPPTRIGLGVAWGIRAVDEALAEVLEEDAEAASRSWVALNILARSCSLAFGGSVSRTTTAHDEQQKLFSTWYASPLAKSVPWIRFWHLKQ